MTFKKRISMAERDRGPNTMMSHGIKHEIIESTISLIATKGSWSISVQEIADACKTTPASLYTYFASKNEIFEDAKEEMAKRFDAVISLPIPERIPEEMKIRMISFYILDFVTKNKWAADFIDPFSGYSSTKKLMDRVSVLLKKNKLSKDELEYRIYRFLAGIHFKIKYRFMRNETPVEADIDDLSRFMSYTET
jgi:AcrR family transcriptional regulator